MKHLISSVTIGACLLLSSAGDVFAQTQTGNPHPNPPSMGGGQLGTVGTGPTPSGKFLTNGGNAGCNFGTTASPQPSPPGIQVGSSGNTSTSSPFPTSAGPPPAPNKTPNYAGAGGVPGNGAPNYGAGSMPGALPNPHANSQYDNACLRQAP
jgi:hypothetical protein